MKLLFGGRRGSNLLHAFIIATVKHIHFPCPSFVYFPQSFELLTSARNWFVRMERVTATVSAECLVDANSSQESHSIHLARVTILV